MIFVFGSQEDGAHHRGAAVQAVARYRAVIGCGAGRQNDAYAIPVKDAQGEPLPLAQVQQHVETFLAYAATLPHIQFRVTAIGCEDGSFRPEDIAPLFKRAPANCDLPYVFLTVHAGLSNPLLQRRLERTEGAATEAVRMLAERFGGVLEDRSDALCVAMADCYRRLRGMEGDEFVADWLLAALREVMVHNDDALLPPTPSTAGQH